MVEFRDLISAETSPHVDAGVTPVPERIGRYRVEKLLGKGGFGLVFLAYDEQLKRAVAVIVVVGQELLRHRMSKDVRVKPHVDQSRILPTFH